MYSLDFRNKVFAIKQKEKLTFNETAKRFGIAINTLFLWSKHIKPKTWNRPTIKINREDLQKDIEQYPDSFQYERAERLGVSKSGIWWALKAIKSTVKKNSNSSKNSFSRRKS